MTLRMPDRKMQPFPAGIPRRYRNALLTLIFLAAVLCVAAGIWWLTRPSVGQALYDELTAAARKPDSTAYDTYQLRAHGAVQLSPETTKPLGGFAFKVGSWLAMLPEVPTGGINIELMGNEQAPPSVYTRVRKRWIPVAMRVTPQPWRSWDRAHHNIPVKPPPNWPGWKILARSKPPPGAMKLRLSGFYGFLPRNCSGVWIDLDKQPQKITSISASYKQSTTLWERTRFMPRLFVQEFAKGRGPYRGQYNLLWHGLVRAGMPPWSASHVIKSAALSLLRHSDRQLVRMAFATSAIDLRGAASAASAVKMAILNMSVNMAKDKVFWAKTRHGGRLCFWLQTPFGIRVLHFDRHGDAYCEEGWIMPILPPSAAPTQWDRKMQQKVAKFLPFFRKGAPWDVPASDRSKRKVIH